MIDIQTRHQPAWSAASDLQVTASVRDIATIPGELFAKFQTGFYSDPRDAAFEALGVE